MNDRPARLRESLALLRAGRFAAAAQAAEPLAVAGDVDAMLLAGLARGAIGEIEAAAALLAAVARARPGHAHPVAELPPFLRQAGREAEIEAHLRAALRHAPGDARLLPLLGEFLLREGRPAEVLTLLPGDGSLPALRGAALAALGRMQEAIAAFAAATEASPRDAAAWSNLGKALAAEAHFDGAIAALDRAAALAPADAQIGLNRAVALLKAGRLPAGWEAFEARLRLPGHTTPPAARRLPGPTAIAGRTVLLTHEEGFGDTLMLLRYAPLLARAGARVIAQVPRELARLAAAVEGVPAVVAPGATPAFDYHCPFMSLPRAFATTLATIPAALPYLHPPPEAIAAWSRALAGVPRPRVGLCWAGAPRRGVPGAAMVDRQRSLDPTLLAPLAGLPGISFVGLQMGEGPVPPGLRLHRVMHRVAYFADTAAIAMHLDLVVSVDTAVVHVAGGAGRPVWLLDRYDNCWRWLSGRDDSPWYPGLRIFRQHRAGAWEPVVARLVESLRDLW